ncbi:hypothetical protein [Actibacterium ureilyticum]|jgi:hypothetical protein|uniref:hypothetical protein n=1 Tax=Actibacterium ureilyticum TaxID=1590614 RepID=UPI00159540BF|nr:hypothetical protein [Actibacterium ureilyticum]
MTESRDEKKLAFAAQKDRASLAERVAPIQSRARALGLRPDGINDKPLMDDLSGDIDGP